MASTPMEALGQVVQESLVDLRQTGAQTLANFNAAGCVRDITVTKKKWGAIIGGAGVAWESMEVDGQETPGDFSIPAELNIGRYRLKHQFSVSRVELKEAASMAPDDLKDIFGDRINSGLIKIAREVNRVMWLGDGSPAFGEVIGIQKVLDPAFPYAGIDPAVYPEWKSLVLTAGSPRPLNRDLILDFEEAVINNENLWNYITCNPSVGKAYTKLFDDLAGVAALPSGRENNVSKLAIADLGHGARYFKGYPLVEDPFCPAGQLVTMQLAPSNIQLLTFDLGTKLDGDDTDRVVSAKNLGLNIHITQLPSNNSARFRFEMYALVQLFVKDRRYLQAIQKLA